MRQKVKYYRPFAFFLFVICLSWIPWWSAVTTAKVVSSVLVKVLIAIGGLGPTFSALILIYTSKNEVLRKDYWQRIFNFKLITASGYLFLFLMFPIVASVAIVISTLFGESFNQFQVVASVRNNLLMILPFILYTFLLGPLPEELGWRGYWLDGLRTKFNGLATSIIIGCVWACWHIPLFLINGYPLHEHVGNVFMLVVYFSLLIPKAIIYT